MSHKDIGYDKIFINAFKCTKCEQNIHN